MANVSRLLYTSTDEESFLRNITIDDSDNAKLRGARTDVRRHLKETFEQQSRQQFGAIIEPRFFTQGSFSYKTINHPAWVPMQQMDMDDGCYLRLNFVKGELPGRAANLFFDFVDAALMELAEEKGWKFAKRPTCSRLIIDDDAHVDVPLYAIPDREFLTLEKAMRARADSMGGRIVARDAIATWEELPSNSVLLAHRVADWIVSDPRKIQNWFGDAVELYGEVLRRVCRYLKAWRDHHYPGLDKVSSILLMACAFEVFEELGRRNVPARDDLVLLKVTERLPKLLEGPVYNPAERTEELDGRLEPEHRKVAIEKARRLNLFLEEATASSTGRNEAVAAMQAAFGNRIPDRPDLVILTEAAKAQVQSHPAKIVPAPAVGRSTSG